jgi:hypothetical protein
VEISMGRKGYIILATLVFLALFPLTVLLAIKEEEPYVTLTMFLFSIGVPTGILMSKPKRRDES